MRDYCSTPCPILKKQHYYMVTFTKHLYLMALYDRTYNIDAKQEAQYIKYQ